MGVNSSLLSKIREDIQINPYVRDKEESFTVFNSSSFYYDSPNAPLKSTQQINIDWSKFENHTFFMSAEAKVNLAFEQIINKFPFDGSKQEIENFIDGLTGYDKWVLDNFPKSSGSLHFNGNSYIEVIDQAGALFPDLSKKNTGTSVINPPNDTTPLSIELQLFLPTITNGNSVICQKRTAVNYGFSLNLLSSTSTSTALVEFAIASGSIRLSASGSIKKGQFNHICAVMSREPKTKISLYVDEELRDSSNLDNVGYIEVESSKFLIGSGSSIYNSSALFTPTTRLSGTIDEFRLFHSARSEKFQKLYAQKSIFATPDLKLYYKFNEPKNLSQPSSDGANSIVLDSSGNSLHAYVTNFNSNLRYPAGINNESPLFCPILFPGHADVSEMNSNLLLSASLYDAENPNIITRLIPPHYLLEGAENDGFGLNTQGNVGNQYSGNSIPGSGKLGSQQVLLSFLYIWAKYFDELKMFVDQFSNLSYVDYDSNESVPDNFLDFYSNHYGLNLANLFSNSTLEQYLSGENVSREVGINVLSLKFVQNEIKRRVLSSLPSILKSKGTQHSIKAFLRSVGIEPGNSVRIREYGGPTKGTLNFSRDDRTDMIPFLKFNEDSYIKSNYLSGSRIEPGFPSPVGTFIKNNVGKNIGTTNRSDGLFTSGSWTFEGYYKFDPIDAEDDKSERTLASLNCVGAIDYSWCKLLATPNLDDTLDTNLTLKIKPFTATHSPILNIDLTVPGKGIFDGEPWYVSFGRLRRDEISSNALSSSFFLRVGKVSSANEDYYESVDDFSDKYLTYGNVQNSYSSNLYGSYIVIGKNNLSSTDYFLNGNPVSSSYFDGYVSGVRFWSKYLSLTEAKEHKRNPFSTGVELPSVNYNYVSNISGSFGKLRLDSVRKQDTLIASGTSGILELLDFSGNNLHVSGVNFSTSSINFVPYQVNFTHVSPYFDEISSNQKVRVRSLDDVSQVGQEQPWVRLAPVHSIYKSDSSTDNNKMSVDFSLVESLNFDIVNSMFCSFEELNNGIGSPNLMFSSDYIDIEKLRDVYFNRLSDHIDFVKFFEFYRWFDTSISGFIEQLIPKRTLFKGVNFIIEPHVLERGKVQYYFVENYSLTPQRAGSNPKSINWLTTTAAKRF